MRYFLVVGEASADLHASRLIEALRRQDEQAEFAYMGGDLMASATGVAPIVHYREVAFMGIIPVLRNLGRIRRSARVVQEAMLAFRPDVVIPLDFAGFNFEYILPFVRKHLVCPIYYYIPPKLWAWKPWRVRTLRKYVDLLLCILPFEEEYFASRGVSSLYVGNPCVDATQSYWLDPSGDKKQIVLLAGSRRQELASNLPIMLQSVYAYRESYRLLLAGAPGLCPADYEPYLSDYPEVELHFGTTYEMLQSSTVALVTSGTATLETALIGTPQIVLYRMGGQRIARWVFEHLFSVPYISLVNLILGRRAVPELIGAEVNAREIQNYLAPLLLNSSARSMQRLSTMELRHKLGRDDVAKTAAEAILTRLHSK